MRVCSSHLMIGTDGRPGLRLGGSLVVRGAGGSGGGLANSELLSAPLSIALPPGREHPVSTVGLDLLPSKP